MHRSGLDSAARRARRGRALPAVFDGRAAAGARRLPAHDDVGSRPRHPGVLSGRARQAACGACPSSTGGAASARASSPRLMEEAQIANLDIAAAVARIVQADAQSRIAGAPLLPAIDFDVERDPLALARRPRQRNPPRRLECELRDRLLGQEPRARCGPPSRARSRAATTARWSRSACWRRSPTSISCCSRRRTGCASRTTTCAAPCASSTRSSSAARSAPPPSSTCAQQESVVATQRAVIPTLEQLMRQNKQHARGADRPRARARHASAAAA